MYAKHHSNKWANVCKQLLETKKTIKMEDAAVFKMAGPRHHYRPPAAFFQEDRNYLLLVSLSISKVPRTL